MKLNELKKCLIVVLLVVMLVVAPEKVYAQVAAQVGFFETYEIQPDVRVEIPLEVRDVQDLYGIDVEVRFDPAVLTVEDANPNQDGVQPALGTFLDAGLILFNTVDNEAGVMRFAMSQVNPSEAKSGDGVVLVLYFRGIAEGESDLTVSMVELATRTGEGIASEGVDSSITVSSGAGESAATSIPVQDPTGAIEIPTLAPTATPTVTPEAAFTPTPQPTQMEDSMEGSVEDVEGGEAEGAGQTQTYEEAQSGFSIVDYWWAVLLLVLLVTGLTIFVFKSKKTIG